MVKKEIFVLLICFTLASLVSAQLSVSETDDVYNLGDRLYVSIDGIVGADSGNLNLNLVCGNSTTNLLKISARAFPKGEGSSYSLPYKIISADDLEISDIGRVVGECNLQASLGSQRASGATFKISDNIIVAASSDKKYYNPGETMTLLIGVEKENGAEYSGEIRLSNFTEDLVLIENEKKLEVEIDSDLAAGEYMINFDLEDGQGNVGSESLLFNVNQVASKIGFGVNKLEIYPGESVSISGEVLDQSGELMYETIDFEITSPRGLVITETLQIGEDILDVSFPYNSTKGEWRIVATSAGLRDELEIEILPSSHLIYDISSNILTVTNIGNELFDGYFNITIAGEQRRVFARLEPAESGQFELSAPSGDYEINLNDGNHSATAYGCDLTYDYVKINAEYHN